MSVGWMDGVAFSQVFWAAAWKGAVLAALVLLVTRLAGSGRAASRHALWVAALSALITLPLLEATLSWRMELGAPALVGLETGAVGIGGSPVLTLPEPRGGAASPQPAAAAMALEWLLPRVWAAGAILVLLRILHGRWAARRLVSRARPFRDADWEELLGDAADRLGVRPVPLMLSGDADLPFTTGMLRPVIVLPAESEQWTRARREAVLLHELAHVRRRDVATHLVAQLACALHWFDPLVWLGAKRMRVESERASDDVVIANGILASSYAADLLDLVRSTARRRVPAGAVAMAQSSEFEGRLLAILRPRPHGRTSSKLVTASVVVAVAGVVLPLVALEPGAIAPPEEQAAALPGDTTAFPALLEALLEDEDAGARAVAAKSLGELGERRALAGLVRAASDLDPEVRLAAVWALNELRDARALTALSAALGDESPPVRRMAARAIGDLDLDAPPAALFAATRDPDPMVRRLALWAIGELRKEVQP